MGWFLYDRDVRHERVNGIKIENFNVYLFMFRLLWQNLTKSLTKKKRTTLS